MARAMTGFEGEGSWMWAHEQAERAPPGRLYAGKKNGRYPARQLVGQPRFGIAHYKAVCLRQSTTLVQESSHLHLTPTSFLLTGTSRPPRESQAGKPWCLTAAPKQPEDTLSKRDKETERINKKKIMNT
jgi:hypothetical protein